MATVSAKAFVAVDDIGSRGNTAGSKVGGRMDVSRSIEDIHFTASVTDSTVRGYEDLNDLLVTGSKKINSASCCLNDAQYTCSHLTVAG